MIKRILVAIDGSPGANAALSIAGSLAGIIGAELVGLFVEDIARFSKGADEQAIEKEIERESVGIYRAFQERCTKASIEGRFLSVRGHPDDVIRDRAKTVDFVLLGNSGEHTGVPGRIEGATVLSLLQTVARPVLVVPDDVAGAPKVVVAYDGSLPSDRALCAAAEFCEISEMTSLHLATATGSKEECKSIQAPALEYLSAYDCDVTPVCLTGKPDDAILAYVEQVDASVLAIAAFGPNRLKESVFGSTTESILKQAQSAVLLVS